MFNSKIKEFNGEDDVYDDESLSSIGDEGEVEISPNDGENGGSSGLTERLREFFRSEGEGDLVVNREENVLQWIQALDLQVFGGCRADERLKPLLKINVSTGVAEDNLLAQLSQHFEVPEVGMLARCLCIPLVSIRVGKVIKQGNFLCPTNIRGNLNLTLLPSSDFRLIFVGDDGCVERLFTLSTDSESSVVFQEIPADKSGLSFFVEHLGQVSYFWCSEQSKITGFELLSKMKDLISKMPSLAQLTGIGKSRLDCFATHLRTYFGTMTTNGQVNTSLSSVPLEWDSNIQASSSSSARHSRPRQGSLSPRSNSFKDAAPRNLSSVRSVVREKVKRRSDNSGCFSALDSLSVPLTSNIEAFTINQIQNKLSETSQSLSFPPLILLDSVGRTEFPPSSNLLSHALPLPPTRTADSSLSSPYYCWCPPSTSSFPCKVSPPLLPIASSEALSLPPLSSLLSAARSFGSLTPAKPPLNLAHASPLDFPAFVPDAVVRVPIQVSSLITVPISQQIPTFTPLMCDPLVHAPVIDVCSSGQAYLVSAGPSLSTSIPPLHSNFLNPLIPETESLVEKGARETLRLLLSSTQTDPQFMEVLPSGLMSKDEKHTTLALGSRGFYSGTRDVEVIANSIAVMGLVSLPNIGEGDIKKKCSCGNSLEGHSQEPGDSERSRCSDDHRKDYLDI